MPLRYEAYKVARGDNLGDPEFWNRRWQDVDLRVARAEDGEARRDAVAEALTQVALDRINNTLLPVYDQLVEIVGQIQGGGFLVAASATSVTLAVGEERSWTIGEPEQRAAFKPTAFFAATRVATVDDWAIVQLVSWDSESGELLGEIVARFGAAGPHEDWVLAALAGPTVAQVALLADALAARADAIAANADAQAAATGLGDAVAAASASAGAAAASETAAADSEGAAAASAAEAAASALSVDGPTIDGRLGALETAVPGKQDSSEKGQADGYAGLDGGAKVPAAQLDLASAADIQAAAAKLMTADQTKAAFAYRTVAYATMIGAGWDHAADYPNIAVELGGNGQFAAPLNMVAGTSGYARIKQDATGGRVPTFDTAVWKNTADVSWSSAANAVDFFHWTVVAGAGGTYLFLTQLAKGI